MLHDFDHARAIFFDVGGTLYSCPAMDQQYPKTLLSLLSLTKGISLDEANELFGRTESILKSEEKHVTKVRVMEALGYSRDQVHAAYSTVTPSSFLAPSPILKEMLATIAERIPLGIISNYRLSHVKDILEVLDVPPHIFSWMVTEDIVREIKPNLEPFFRAAELAHLAPSQCVFVGDSATKDMYPARQVGMGTILVKKDPKPQDLASADAIIDSVECLGDIFHVKSFR